MIRSIFLIVNNCHEKTKTNNYKLTQLTRIGWCGQRPLVLIPLCHCCPNTKHTSIGHIFALGDILLHNADRGHCKVYFGSTPHTPSCCHKYSLVHTNTCVLVLG